MYAEGTGGDKHVYNKFDVIKYQGAKQCVCNRCTPIKDFS